MEYLGKQKRFNVTGARKEGYSDTDILQHLSGGSAQPKPAKIGAEGFKDAFEQVVKENPMGAKLAAGATTLRNMYEGGKQLLGMEDKQAITAQKVLEEKNPGSALAGGVATYGLTARGGLGAQSAIGGVSGFLQPADSAGERAKNTALGTVAGAGGKLLGDAAGAVTGKLLGRSEAKAAEKAGENAVRDATLKEGREIGLVVPGSATGERGMTRKAVESVGGKAALGQEASIRNQQVVNQVAKAEAGIPDNQPITEQTLGEARRALSAPYREVANLSQKAANDLEKLKGTRTEAKSWWQFYNRSGDPKALKKAQTLDTRAETLESSIEKEAVKATMGQSALAKNLVERLREARVSLAKNFTVEKAVNLGNGNVDAAVIGRLYNKVGDKGMTGGLRTIGKFQQAFPDFMRSKPSGQVGPGIGALRPYAAALGLGIGAEQAHERLGLSPYMMGAAALPLLGGPARSLALSRAMQGAPSYGSSLMLRGANEALPRAAGALPLAAEGALSE